ncbi:hypothetical protein PR048_010688 [Dryococelus australis]|uniref:F-box domain-containing protein n=1 Tax=Dryococelus australis TaxID=614101 RepID=A0ABQ9I5D7_9NEOP|nr:hypothetical protein PR048_010688 [Dryococelus australis]
MRTSVMRPLTIDESTDSRIPETLVCLIGSVLENHSDDDVIKTNHLFVVLLCTLMMECGFSLIETFEKTGESAYLPSFDIRRLRSVQRMPCDWWSEQENLYKLKFRLLPTDECSCLLTVMPLKYTMIVNIVVPDKTTLDQVINFPTTFRYVKSSSGDFADLRNLSREFKDGAVVPVRCRLLEDKGLASTHLAGMPGEVLLLIMRLLDSKSLACLSQTCHRLSEACQDDSLWRPLCTTMFGAEVANTTNDMLKKNWYAVFSSLMMKSIAERRRNQHRFHFDTDFDSLSYSYLIT